MGFLNLKRDQPDEYDEEIGRKIKQAREEAKLTQAQLGQKVYKSQGNISDYEAGRHSITAMDLFLVASATEKPVDFFIPFFYGYAPQRHADLTTKEQELIHFIRNVGDENRENRVIDLLIEHAKTLSNLIIHSDMVAMRSGKAKNTQKKK